MPGAMKEEISIKVNIADVVYPLKVSIQDEENVRKAAKLINEKIKLFKNDYEISDKSNLLSMVALQFACEVLQYKDKAWIEVDGVSVQVKDIQNLLAESLKA
jgi:cell division protein ZapA